MEYLSLDHGGKDVGLVEAELQRVSKKSVAIYYELSFLATLFSQANLMVGSERFLRRTTALKVKVTGTKPCLLCFLLSSYSHRCAHVQRRRWHALIMNIFLTWHALIINILLTLNIILDFFSYYYTLNSLSLFLLAEGVQWIFEINACDVI